MPNSSKNKRTPDLSYTSRDYSSILEELIAAIPNVSKTWNSRSEADPGIVLLKLVSQLGDMLSYNQDKQALEVYPDLVTQRKNAAQIFRLIGYKMHWYRSARCGVTITNAGSFPITIPRYTTIRTADSSIPYTNIEQMEIPSGRYYEDNSDYDYELVQGTPVTPSLVSGTYIPNSYNDPWHSIYNYNVSSSVITTNNRIYLAHSKVDESTIALVDNDEDYAENEWTQVENLNTSSLSGKIFEFNVDENNKPYIQLPSYWNTKYIISKFKLFYIISDGEAGEIMENSLTAIDSSRIYSTTDVTSGLLGDNIKIYNSASTYGYGYETPDEARNESEKYSSTMDTLVTLEDFTKATKRIEGIANAMATDSETDPRGANMDRYMVKIYAIRDDGYVDIDNYNEYMQDGADLFKTTIESELVKNKLMPYKFVISLENEINFINWGLSGKIYLKEPVSTDRAHDLLVSINNNMMFYYSSKKMSFNDDISYMDVIDKIMETDSIIRYVDLDPISYEMYLRNNDGNHTGFSIAHRYLIYEKDRGYTRYQITDIKNGEIIKDDGEPTGYETYCGDIIDRRSGEDNDTGYAIRNKYGKTSWSFTSYNKQGVGVYDLGSGDYEIQVSMNNSYDTINKNGIRWSNDIDDPYTEYPQYYNYVKYVPQKSGKLEIKISQGDNNDDPYAAGLWSRSSNGQLTQITPIINDNGRYIFECDANVTYYFAPLNVNQTMTSMSYSYDLGIIDGEEDFYIVKEDSDGNVETLLVPKLNPDGSTSYTQYYLKESRRILDEEGNDIGSYVVDKYTIAKNVVVYNAIIEGDYDEFSGYSIDSNTGEIMRYLSDNRYMGTGYYLSSSGDIVDNMGSIILDGQGIPQTVEVSKEYVTGKYEQYNSSSIYEQNEYVKQYKIYLGLDDYGNILVDSVGNEITGFPVKPGTVSIHLNGDSYVISDNGSGRLICSDEIMNGLGTIDYTTGLIEFGIYDNVEITGDIVINYTKNSVNMLRYNGLNINKFSIAPEYIMKGRRWR